MERFPGESSANSSSGYRPGSFDDGCDGLPVPFSGRFTFGGIYYGWRAQRILSARMRLPEMPVWEMVVFILNGVLFMLIGLQLPQVIHALAPSEAIRVAMLAILVVSVIVLVRFIWIFGSS